MKHKYISTSTATWMGVDLPSNAEGIILDRENPYGWQSKRDYMYYNIVEHNEESNDVFLEGLWWSGGKFMCHFVSKCVITHWFTTKKLPKAHDFGH